MTISVNREQWLAQLISVQAGISKTEIVEQSDCFVFKDGYVYSFDDETACSSESLVDINGAVQAIPLIDLLKKLKEEEITVIQGEGELLVCRKKKKAGIRMQQEILLPVDTIDYSNSEWNRLDKEFTEAVLFVLPCCGKDESSFALTCVHITNSYIEACDNLQAVRYSIDTSVKEDVLLRKASVKHIKALNMSRFNETENWFHFKNKEGLILSCRRYVESYPEMEAVYGSEGDRISFPTSIVNSAENAFLFSKENTRSKDINVSIMEGKIRISGEGTSGWYEEVKKIDYNGDPFSFTIDYKLLKELVNKHNEFEITKNKIKVEGDKFVYVAALGE